MRSLEPGHLAFVAICHLLTTPKSWNSQNEKYIGVVPDPFPPTNKKQNKKRRREKWSGYARLAMHRPTTTYTGWGWGIVGESTTKLPPGSGDLSFYILQLIAIQTLLSFLTKCSHVIVGPVGGNLYFSEVQIPTFPYLSPYYVVVGFTLIGALLVLHSQTTFSFCLGMAKKGLVQLRCFCAGFPLLLSECWLVTTSGAVNFLDVLIYIG